MIQEIFQLGGPNLAVIPRQIVVAWAELLEALDTRDELRRRLADTTERAEIRAYWTEWAAEVNETIRSLAGTIDTFMGEASRLNLAVPLDMSTAWNALKERAS